jgi:hypothetical protein
VDRPEPQRHADAYREDEFCRRVNRVVELWTQMVSDHQMKRVNVKTLRDLSKAFHELEKSDAWVNVKSRSDRTLEMTPASEAPPLR